MLWNQIGIFICICHLQSGTQVGGKSGGHGREKRERVARSQPGWGGWHAWHCFCICICTWKSLYLCLKVMHMYLCWIFLYLGARWDGNYYLDWKVGGRRDGERGRGFGQLLTIRIWHQEQQFWPSNFDPLSVQLFEKALGWWGSLVFFIFLETTPKLCIEASKDRTWEGGGSLGWIWSRCLAWFHFSLPAVRVQLLLLVSQHLRVSYWSPGMMRCLGFDDDQDGYGPEKDCLDGELLWPWPW